MNIQATYQVTGDAGDMEGWTAENYAEALQTAFDRLGWPVEVLCNPNTYGIKSGEVLLDATGIDDLYVEREAVEDIERVADKVSFDGPTKQ